MQLQRNIDTNLLILAMVCVLCFYIIRRAMTPEPKPMIVEMEPEILKPEIPNVEFSAHTRTPRFRGYYPFYRMRHHMARYPLLKR